MRLSLFKTRPVADAGALYAAVVAEARRPAWYVEAQVPDTMDGRFAVLTSLLALLDIRLERGGEKAKALAPRLAEAFIADMDAQMRQAGFGDPSLGKQVRKMVGALAGEVDLWRRAVAGAEPWGDAARSAFFKDAPPADEAAAAATAAAQDWWRRLQQSEDVHLAEGRIA